MSEQDLEYGFDINDVEELMDSFDQAMQNQNPQD